MTEINPSPTHTGNALYLDDGFYFYEIHGKINFCRVSRAGIESIGDANVYDRHQVQSGNWWRIELPKGMPNYE